MTNPADAYAKIHAAEETPHMTLEVNSECELGQAIMETVFNKEGNWIRKSTDPLPEIHLELKGKRYRFKMGYDTKIDMEHNVFKFSVECYGGIPSDNDR
jgi:hypothetical protein